VRAGGSAEKFQYDAANRLVKVTDDYGYALGTYTYGSSTERLIADEGGWRTYYSCDASVEYSESGGSTTPIWSKTYVLLGARLLATITPNGSNGENIQYHHPDRLGTRLVTNAQDTTFFEQQTLPYGTALNESAPTGGATGGTNKRFTSYDRSPLTGLDYAVNRHYDSQQGRFTQVDPIGMRSVSLESPQTLNLYAYCMNDPVNHTDPSGLGFFSFLKKIFKAILKILSNKWVQIALMVAMIAVLHFYYHYNFGFGVVSNAPSGAAPVLHAAATSTVAAASSGGAALSAGITGTFLAGVAVDEGILVGVGSLLTDLGTLALGTAAAVGAANHAAQKNNAKTNKKTEQKKPEKSPCSSKFSDFFANLDLYKDVASQLNTKLEFILAHSAWESGWNGPHAKELHNLFGLTNAGKANLTFSSYKAGADKYVSIVQPHVTGAQSIDNFVDGIQKAGYNTKTKGYYDRIKEQVDSVRKHAKDCGVAL
jgi:RHS repeat-associated protein